VVCCALGWHMAFRVSCVRGLEPAPFTPCAESQGAFDADLYTRSHISCSVSRSRAESASAVPRFACAAVCVSRPLPLPVLVLNPLSASFVSSHSPHAEFKIRTKKLLWTLVIKDEDKANKLKQSLPPGLQRIDLPRKA